MTTKSRSRLLRTLYALTVVAVSSGGVLAGRTFASDAEDAPPTIGELRGAPDVYVLPSRPYESPPDLARSVDAVGVIRVNAVTNVKDLLRTSEFTGLEIAWGHADVMASVVDVIKGDSAQLQRFAFDAVFVPGTDELAISTVNPPLEVGQEYLVFLEDGSLAYPGGTYRVQDGRVWNIGHWESADSRRYPNDLSGLTVDEALAQLAQAVAP